jgi:hypothetical protein
MQVAKACVYVLISCLCMCHTGCFGKQQDPMHCKIRSRVTCSYDFVGFAVVQYLRDSTVTPCNRGMEAHLVTVRFQRVVETRSQDMVDRRRVAEG